jgi:uncharacterized membrane protein
MQKLWEGSVRIEAPVDEVWALVSDFARHPEWDNFTKEISLDKPGGDLGVGSEWKVREHLGMLRDDNKKKWLDHGVAPARREVRHVVPGTKIVWHTHPVPKVGVSAEFTFEFADDAGATVVTQIVNLHVPGVMDVVGRVLIPSRDRLQQEAWQRNLDNLKRVVETADVREAVAV